MSKNIEELFNFIENSPTSYNSVKTASVFLDNMGCKRLSESENWEIKAGEKYYVTRNGSSIIAFCISAGDNRAFKIIASHCDSPIFKFKHNFEMPISDGYVKINVEKYGGMIIPSWLDRPLSVAGRILVEDGDEIHTKIVDLKKPVLIIPSMPIHFNGKANDGFVYNPQIDAIPIAGGEESCGGIIREIAACAGVKEEDVIDFDLYAYCAQEGTVTGIDGEYITAPRIDDLECAFASLKAFKEAEHTKGICICSIFDNEEVGSGTKQGADSSFLSDVIDRLSRAIGMSEDEKLKSIASGFMLSADNAHAVHPNHPEKYDATNKVYINGGVVIKFNANQKYTSDGMSAAVFRKICKKAGLKTQSFSNRSDVPGGSTLGNISSSHISINTVDIGAPQLAMHSAVETAGTGDFEDLILAMTAFYDADISSDADGRYVVR